MNLTSSGLLSSARQDVVNRQLSNMAATGTVYDQTSKAKVSNHETDKQAEDNATWFFEYKALLNSKLTTLTTSLTSAYTTDLDASMGLQLAVWGGKTAMQGITGNSIIAGSPNLDAGAARTAYGYLTGFTTMSENGAGAKGKVGTPSDATWRGDSASSSSQTASVIILPDQTQSDGITGTTTFVNSSSFVLDNLHIDFKDTAPTKTGSTVIPIGSAGATGNYYDNDKDAATVERNILDEYNAADGSSNFQKIGNNFEMTLFKFFAKPENFDLLRFGLFDNLYIVGTSSLATGSQVQGSVSLTWDNNNGKIVIKQERFAAFYHS